MDFVIVFALLFIVLACSNLSNYQPPESSRKITEEKTEFTVSDGFMTATYTEIRSAKKSKRESK